MSEPGILVGGRGHRGGYGPYSRFGELELLYDARSTVGLEGAVAQRIPDLSSHGTNWLDALSAPLGLTGRLRAIGGQSAFGVVEGLPGQGGVGRSLLPRPLGRIFTILAVVRFHAQGNNIICARNDGDDQPAGGQQWYLLTQPGGFMSMFGGQGSDLIQAGSAVTVDAPYLVTAVWNGAASVLRLNRSQVATGNVGSEGVAKSLRIGSGFGGGADMNGQVGMIAGYRGVPAIAALEEYAARDWRF